MESGQVVEGRECPDCGGAVYYAAELRTILGTKLEVVFCASAECSSPLGPSTWPRADFS
jgi:hypothetical protein